MFNDGDSQLFITANKKRNQLYLANIGPLTLTAWELGDVKSMFTALLTFMGLPEHPAHSYNASIGSIRQMPFTLYSGSHGHIRWAHNNGETTTIELISGRERPLNELTLDLERGLAQMHQLIGITIEQLIREPKEEELYE
jgi:hypothetical protein